MNEQHPRQKITVTKNDQFSKRLKRKYESTVQCDDKVTVCIKVGLKFNSGETLMKSDIALKC